MIYETKDWSSLRAALIERYGEPTLSQVVPVQNRMGATFENEHLEWSGREVTATVLKYGTDLTRGAFMIGLNFRTMLEKNGRLEAAKDAASRF